MTAANMVSRPNNEADLQCSTTSIASSPVASSVVSTNAGFLQRVMAAAAGTTSVAPATIAVTINGSVTDVCSGGFQVPIGTGPRAGVVFEFALYGQTNPAPFISEGDVITFTPSGSTGASIPGAFAAVIRQI
jgi:hypothetical protein